MASTFHHNGYDDVIVDILQGRERIVSYPATHQLNGHISTCDLAAINFVSVLFDLIHHHGQERPIDVLRAITSKEILEDIISICSGWPSDVRLNVGDIQRVAPFDKSLKYLSTTFAGLSAEEFKGLLQRMQTLGHPAALVITCAPSPETIACAKISGLELDVFVIFDPHPRPSYPSGAGLILSTSIDQAIARLASIFPFVDEDFPSEGDLQSQAHRPVVTLNRVFISNGPGDVRDLRRSAIESGLAVQRLEAEITELRLALVHRSQSPQDHHTSSSPTTLNDSDLVNGREAESSGTALILELNPPPQPFECMPPDQAAVPPTSYNFSCAICMDEQPMDDRVELDCNHPICRKCTRSHVCAKIGEHRFPVLCPVCMTEPNDQPGVISGLVIRLIGINEEQYAIWEEMELSQLSVLIHCRRCGRSVLVDRQEHEESRMLICPLPNCNHSWCKACQQPIAAQAEHSCNGAAELDDLMRQQGGNTVQVHCRTPVERNRGCRHMTCIAPGCNTHFCYACGGHIVRSALQSEIQGAVATHYSGTCQMFDDLDNEGIELGVQDGIEHRGGVEYEAIVHREAAVYGEAIEYGEAVEYDEVVDDDDEDVEDVEDYEGSQCGQDVEGVEDGEDVEDYEGSQCGQDVEDNEGVEYGEENNSECVEDNEGIEYGEENDSECVEDNEGIEYGEENDSECVEDNEGIEYGEDNDSECVEDNEGIEYGEDAEDGEVEDGEDVEGYECGEGDSEYGEGVENDEGIECDEGVEDDEDDHDVEDFEDDDGDDDEDYYYSD